MSMNVVEGFLSSIDVSPGFGISSLDLWNGRTRDVVPVFHKVVIYINNRKYKRTTALALLMSWKKRTSFKVVAHIGGNTYGQATKVYFYSLKGH